MMSFDDSPIESNLSSKYFELLVDIIKNVNYSLGDHYFKNDKVKFRIRLILDCNKKNIKGGILKQTKKEYDVVYSFNLEELKHLNYDFSFFVNEINNIVEHLFQNLNYEQIKISSILSNLKELFSNYEEK